MTLRWMQDVVWPVVLTLVVVILASWAYLARVPFLEELELKAFDLRMRARGPIAPSGQVVIVAIDEHSLERVGRWPWSRDVMARLVKALDGQKPRGVGYDIGFFDPQTHPAREELVLLARQAASLGIRPTKKFLAHVKQRLIETNGDLHLALALQNATSPQILGYYFNMQSRGGEKTPSLERAALYPVQKRLPGQEVADPPVPMGRKVRSNIDLVARAATSQAYFNIFPDADGTIRRYNLAMGYEGQWYQPLAAAMACLTQPRVLPTLLLGPLGLVEATLGQQTIACDAAGRVLVNYRGPAQTIPHIPAWRILEDDVSSRELENKFVLVGVTAPAVYDLRVTPYGVAYPGIEIQATALDNMLVGDFLARPGWASLFDLAAIAGLGLVCLIVLWRIHPVVSVMGFVGFFAGYVVLNQYFFVHHLYWLNMVYPLTALVCSYVTLTVYRFIFADRKKRQIRQAFSKYLDPHVVKDVVDDPEKLRLGGVKQELTVLFSDIRGFTSISEQLSPENLVRLLNEYLSEMTAIVMARQGLLDKYIGDAIMAVFGAPRHYAHHAAQACRVALEMVSCLEELNRQWQTQDWGPNGPPPPLSIGVGINTGWMVAGNMGSRERFDYTVMGDNVNLGSRLEGLNKVYGTRIIISQSTLDQLDNGFWVRSLDRVRVKGKEHPVAIYELLGEKNQNAPCPLAYLKEYETGRSLYEQGDFGRADAIFARLQQRSPKDPVITLYRNRLKALQANPPGVWDKVYTCTSK